MSGEKESKSINVNLSPVRLDLTDAATVFINRVSDLMGGLAKPWQIERLAKAEAKAVVIKATAEIQISDLQKRAMHRFVNEQALHQSNMEQIATLAAPQITDAARPNDVAEDWITNFFNKCRLVSDEQMQTLWAKLLAGEANSPGSYSKRALMILESFDKSDAELFEKLCRFNWKFGNVINVPIVIDCSNPIYVETGLLFGHFKHLEAIGLVTLNELTGFGMRIPDSFMVSYAEQPFLLRSMVDMRKELPVGQVLLTQAGRELSGIVTPEPLAGFCQHVVEYWKKSGFSVKEESSTLDGWRRESVPAVSSNPIPEQAAVWAPALLPFLLACLVG